MNDSESPNYPFADTTHDDCDPEEEQGICMNCGAEMDYNPYHPWCAECDEEDEDEDA